MRWTKKIKAQYGDTRIRRSFLFFPKCIQLDCRWLEMATWVEEYKQIRYSHRNGRETSVYRWEPLRWED